MKKILLIMISFMAIILLSGCGKLEMGSDTSINTDGSGYFSMKLIYDNIIAQNLKDGVLKEENVRKYRENKDYIEEYKVEFKNVSELNKKLSNRSQDYKVTITENKGILNNKYTYEMRFLNYYDATSIANSLNIKTEMTVSTTNNDRVNSFLDEVAYTNTVTLPGKIITSNASERSGNTLRWSYYLGQISPETVMTATYTMENTTGIRIIYTIVSILIILTVVYIIRKIRMKRIV